MIQRKQTLFLLAGLALMASLMFIDLASFAGSNGIFALRFFGLREVTNPQSVQLVYYIFSLATLVIASVTIELVSIFLFRRRPLQMRLCGINVGLKLGVAVVIFWLSRSLATDIDVEWHFAPSCLVPVLAAVLGYLAYRGISDDEAIIRSLNRLR